MLMESRHVLTQFFANIRYGDCDNGEYKKEWNNLKEKLISHLILVKRGQIDEKVRANGERAGLLFAFVPETDLSPNLTESSLQS